jgi:hypothetical protein
MMGEKKAEKVVQEGSGTSFLAGQVQPSPATSEVGIQEQKAKTEQKQEVKTEKPKEEDLLIFEVAITQGSWV